MTRWVATLVLAACAAVPLTAGFSTAGFTAASANPGTTVSSDPDWAAPGVARAAVVRQGATTPGLVAPGASYFVYASVADSGNPASGTASVTADLSALTATAAAAPLTAGAWTVAGQPYNFRGGPFTVGSLVGDGTAAFTVATSDLAGNSATATGFSATVDSIRPAASDVQAAAGGTAARLEAGDTLALTFSEVIEPSSVAAGWDGTTPVNVVVRLNRAAAGGNDNLTFYASGNTTQLPLGTVDLGRSDYTGGNVTFGASGTVSTLAHSAVTVGGRSVSRLTVTLGTASGATKTAKGPGTLTWQPASGVFDPAGNPLTSAAAVESGAADTDF